MKRKKVMRLLAVVMAASLAVTSVPGTTLTRIESVYADDFQLETSSGVSAATYNSITMTESEGNTFAAVPVSNDVQPGKDAEGVWFATEITGLAPGTAYKIYQKDSSGNITTKVESQSTKKINLATDSVVIALDHDSYEYDGQEKNPTVTSVTIGDYTLPADEYTATTYSSDVTNVTEDHYVTVAAAGEATKCEGTINKTFTITAASIADATVTLNTKDVDEGYSVTYDGTAKQDPTVAVTVDGRTLTSGSDFEASFTGNKTKAGTVSVTITGKGNYTGTVKAENIPAYTIIKDNSTTAPTISQDTLDENTDTQVKIKIEGSKPGYTYEYAYLTTEQVKAGVEPTYAKTVEGTGSDTDFTLTGLTAATDYTVYCRVKNTDDHAASDVTKLTVTTATAKSENIESFTDTQIVVTAEANYSYIAVKTDAKPGTGIDGWVEAQNASGYKAALTNLDPGTEYFIYKKDASNNVTRVGAQTTERAPLSGATVVIMDGGSEKASGAYSVEYTGEEQKPTVKVTTAGNKELTLNKDYTVVYENNTNVGTNATVIVTGIGQYKDSPSSSFTFSITQASIENATVTVGGKDYATGYSVTYDGTEKQDPEVKVTLKGKQLEKDTDFTLGFGTSKTNAGTVDMTISGKGNYTGTPSQIPTYTIAKDTNPTVPTLAETADSVTDKSFGVTITNYEAKYTYEYAIVKTADIAEETPGSYTELNSAAITSAENLAPATNYTVYCRVKNTDDHAASNPVTIAVTTKAEALTTSTVTVAETAEYSGADNAPTVTVSGTKGDVGYTVKYYKQDADESNGTEVDAPKAAGTYNVVVTGDGTNYSGEITKTYKITKKTVTAKATEVKDKEYDGNTSVKVTADFDSGMILGNDDVTIPELTGTLESSDAKEGIKLSSVTSTDVVLEGADAGNYTLGTVATNNLTATITKQSNVTFSGTSTYTVAVGQTITLDTKNNVDAAMKYTLVDSEEKEVTDSAITVGTGTVTLNSYLSRTDLQIKVEISADGGTNYDATGKSKLISLNFAKQAPYIKIGATENWNSDAKKLVISKSDAKEDTFKTKLAAKLYYVTDDKTPQGEAVLDKTLTYTYNGDATFPTEEGTYTVEITYTPEGADDDNIEAASETITLVIAGEKKALSITVDNKSYTVGGTVPTYTFSATAGGNPVTLTTVPTYKICNPGTTEEVQLNSSTATGTYDIVATFTLDATDAALYTLDAQDVTAGTLTVSAASTYTPSSDTTPSNTDEPTIKENEDGTKTIVDADGKVIANNKVTIDGKSYITGNDGEILTSQIAETPSGNKVYVDKDGVIVKNKAVTCDGKKYYATRTGKIATNGFVTTAKGNKVYATKSGALKVSKTFTVNGKKYYAKASGAIATTGFVKTASGNTVYATKSGALKVNKAFKAADGKKYVADKNGKIVKGKKITIGNKTYTTNKKGVIIKVTTKKK
jgi:hypothetical protein